MLKNSFKNFCKENSIRRCTVYGSVLLNEYSTLHTVIVRFGYTVDFIRRCTLYGSVLLNKYSTLHTVIVRFGYTVDITK